MLALVTALVTSRLDYCNSVLAALPQSTIEPLQRVQRALQHGWFSTSVNANMCRHASSSCTGYQFLTESPTNFALSCTTSTSESLRVIWPTSCMQPTSSRVTRSGLRSLSLSLWDRQLHHTSAAHQVRRAGFFSFSGPASWNSLPAELRTISDTSVFKNKLKTYLFGLAFDIRTQ